MDRSQSRYYRIRSTGEPQVIGIPESALPWLKAVAVAEKSAEDGAASARVPVSVQVPVVEYLV